MEVKPLTQLGRLITIVVITTGVSIGGYTLGMILQMVVEGELKKSYGRRKLERKIVALKNHFIVCGYGRIGKLICKELAKDNLDFVIIEVDEKISHETEKDGYLFLNMDATSEEALVKAGIKNAKGLVTAVKSDADNVFIVLTAKGIRPDLYILSRSSDPSHEDKLLRAGASQVVCPYLIGGKRMSQMLRQPNVVDFIDIATMGNNLGLMMEEDKIGPGSHLIGKTLIESNVRRDFGVIIVSIKRPSGEIIYNPLPTEKLGQGDIIVVLGKKEDLKRMSEIL
jgi:voltage-gated potassium channel